MKITHKTPPIQPLHVQLPTGHGARLWSQYREAAAPLWAALAPLRLSARQRTELSGVFFPGAAELVDATAEAMAAEPLLFTHVPRSGEAIAADQHDALDLLFLSQALAELSQLAFDGYVRKHAPVVGLALQVLKEQRLEAQRALLSPAQRAAHHRREGQLQAAQKVLSWRRVGRPHKAAGKKKRPRG